MAQLSDAEIAQLIAEKKKLPATFRVKPNPRHGHSEQQFDTIGSAGGKFRVSLRESLTNTLAFSAILAYQLPGTNTWFRLRRYNGGAHEHTNRLEGDTISLVSHIHIATERYQDAGHKEDAYAEPSSRFATLAQAAQCLFEDCGFDVPPPPPPPQPTLTF